MMSRTIHAIEGVTQKTKKASLLALLETSGFYKILERKDAEAPVVIKGNFTPTSQKKYHYYTDPDLINALVSEITRAGYKNVAVAESETHFSDAYPKSSPENTAKVIGIKGKVINLSHEPTTRFQRDGGKIRLSNVMIEAAASGLLVDCCKAKNHEVFVMTACLKNMYGSIPAKNKFTLFHQKKSGLNVPQATHAVNTITPPHFHVVDFIEGVDGDERALFFKPLEAGKRGVGIDPALDKAYYPSRMILCGQDGLALDKFITLKMGHEDQDESPITKYHAEQVGNFDVRRTRVVGSTFDPLPGWKKVSWHWLIHGMIEHQLPVNEATIAAGIRRYHFDPDLANEKAAK